MKVHPNGGATLAPKNIEVKQKIQPPARPPLPPDPQDRRLPVKAPTPPRAKIGPLCVTLNRRASRLVRKHLRENPEDDVRDVVAGAVYFMLADEQDWSGSCPGLAKADRLEDEQKGAA